MFYFSGRMMSFEQRYKKVDSMKAQIEGVMLSKREWLARLNIEVMQLVKKYNNDEELRTCIRRHQRKCPALKST